MKRTNLLFLIVFGLLALILSGCTGSSAGASSWPGVSTDENTAYLAYNQYVYAVNLSNGSQVWRYPEKGAATRTFYAPPVLTEDGQLLVSGYDSQLVSLNPATGAENWVFTGAENRLIASPLVVDDTIYAPSSDGRMFAINLNGSPKWTFEADAALWAQPAYSEECRCLYLTSMDHHLYSVSVDNGALAWKLNLGASIVGTPALDGNGSLYVGTFGKQLVSVDVASGQILWQTPTQDWVWAGPLLEGDKLYFGDLGGTFYAMNKTDGAILWQVQPDGPVTSTPIWEDEVIYFTTEMGSLYAYSPDGVELWKHEFEKGMLYAPPVSAAGNILVAPTQVESLLVSFMPRGALRWSFIPPQ